MDDCGRRKAKGVNQNRKSPKFDWSSLLSAVNLVDEVRVESAFIPKHVVKVKSSCTKIFYVYLCLVPLICRISVTGASYSAPNQHLTSGSLRGSLRLPSSLSPSLYSFMPSEPKVDMLILSCRRIQLASASSPNKSRAWFEGTALNHLSIYAYETSKLKRY